MFFPSLFLYQPLQLVEKFLFRVHSLIFSWKSLVLSFLGSTLLMSSSDIILGRLSEILNTFSLDNTSPQLFKQIFCWIISLRVFLLSRSFCIFFWKFTIHISFLKTKFKWKSDHGWRVFQIQMDVAW